MNVLCRSCILPAAMLLCLAPLGCHRPQPAPPPPPPAPQAQQAPLTASNITVITPLPSVPATAGPNVQPTPASAPAPKTTAADTKHKRHHLRRAKDAEQTAQVAQAAQAAVPPATAAAPPDDTSQAKDGEKDKQADAAAAPVIASAPAASPAADPLSGQWSTGTAISTGQRTHLLDAISAQEKRIANTPNATHADVAAVLLQVRAFLTKARDAVANNDLDGAQTLNMKAQVLLDELQKGS